VLESKLAAPQGFEPRYADPESAVLPLNEGATCAKGDHAATHEHAKDRMPGAHAQPDCNKQAQPDYSKWIRKLGQTEGPLGRRF
jgi:hypothetical protein